MSKLHLPTLRALAYARATRPDALEAITVSVDEALDAQLVHKWGTAISPCRSRSSPRRAPGNHPARARLRQAGQHPSPRTVVTVFIPEYVPVGIRWEQLLHNQSALLEGRLLFMPNVMVTSVPWQLSSSERVKPLEPHAAPGDARRGFLD